MTDWTDDAHQAFDAYAARARPRLRRAGADPEEVLSDLRQHIDQLAHERGLQLLTAGEVSQMLASIGELEPSMSEDPALPAPLPAAEARSHTTALWLCGVIVPMLALIVQAATGISSAVIEPMPSALHGVLIATVPGAVLLGLRELARGPTRYFSAVRLLVGAALMISGIYTLLFLPLAPFMVILALFGIGFLGLSPLLGLLSLWGLDRRLTRIAPAGAPARTLRGMGLGFFALVLVELPTLVSGIGMHLADSSEPGRARTGLWILRHVGDEPTMRANAQRNNFEEGARRASLLLFPVRMLDPVSRTRAEELYYRATGEVADRKPALTHNDRPLALGITRSGWDQDLGGDQVGGVLADLSLSASRMDVHVEPENGLSYMEWTQEFSNEGVQAREARAQWLLPEGAVVSRVTLWVEGEAREAAFAPTAQVKAAYQEVAVKQRRDPLLVTWSGPNTVMVQAFPINPKVPLKIRIGITAPLRLDAHEHGVLSLPALVETNYQEPSKLKHYVWVESSAALRANLSALTPLREAHVLRGALRGDELSGVELDTDRIDPSASRAVSATLKGFCLSGAECEADTGMVQQRWHKSGSAPEAVAFVIDGSLHLADHRASIAKLIADTASTSRVRAWLAADEPVPLSDKDATGVAEHTALAKRVREAEFIGGMDDTLALVEALDWLEGRAGAQLVWIHGSQGISLDTAAALEQRIERASVPVQWTSLQLGSGAHRTLQAAAPFADIVSLQGTRGLERVRAMLAGDASWTLARTWIAPGSASEVSASLGASHIVRLWANQLIATRAVSPALSARLAAQQQLVTRISGAVVLERKEQYDRNGLEPVDATSVPTIPEPPVLVMLLAALCLFGLYRYRARSRPCDA